MGSIPSQSTGENMSHFIKTKNRVRPDSLGSFNCHPGRGRFGQLGIGCQRQDSAKSRTGMNVKSVGFQSTVQTFESVAGNGDVKLMD